MGNEQIKQELQKVTTADFAVRNLDPFVAKLWTFENQDDFSYNSFLLKIAEISKQDCKEQFLTRCLIDEDNNEQVAEARLKFDADRVQAAGFTTAEKKIEDLRQEGK